MKSYFRFTRTLLLFASIIVLNACTSESSITALPAESTLLFQPCEEVSVLDCGVFDVPLIHDSTDNRQISIDLARLPGIGDGPHEPLLLIIDGSGSGTQTLQELTQREAFPDVIRERYDIIGFDQRGAGNSLRVDCDHLGNTGSIPYPRGQTDVMTLVAEATMLADSCSAEYTDQLQWVSSNAVVQDMDIMRSLLNAPKLNIIAGSFGTRVTALYLERFPEASGRIVLDAPLPPNGNIEALLHETAAAQQVSLELMLNACGTTLPECDRTLVESEFVARMNTLLDDGDLSTFNAFAILLSSAIEETGTGELLAPLLIDYVFSGDPTDMFILIEEFGLDEENGDENERLTLERAVICADDPVRPSVESLLTTLGSLNEASDLFAETNLPMAVSCAGWPEALDPITDIHTADAPASLVIGGIGDVRTPISAAVETADAIGGVFIASGHQGHTTLFLRENECVDSLVLEFLLEGTLPSTGTSCN